MRLQVLNVFALSLILLACPQQREKSPREFIENYQLKKVPVGTFQVSKTGKAGIYDSHGVQWMTMHRKNLTFDDLGKSYVYSKGEVFIYDEQGSYKSKIVLEKADSLTGPIEVSSDGSVIFIRGEKDNIGYTHIYALNGRLTGVRKFAGYQLQRSCRDQFWGEEYSKGQKTGLHLFDKNLKIVKDLNSYYLTQIKLNERPIGFFDSEGSFYFMHWSPIVVKLDPSGNTVYEKNVQYKDKTDNWRLIGIDSHRYLYALMSEALQEYFVKLNGDGVVMAILPLGDQITSGYGAMPEGDEVFNFKVSCNGTVYFVPNYIETLNPVDDEQYRKYIADGEYVIYKIERTK